jgi:hypothetical protein
LGTEQNADVRFVAEVETNASRRRVAERAMGIAQAGQIERVHQK